MNLQNFKAQLSHQDILEILHSFGIEYVRDSGAAFVFPTYCHNLLSENASHKMYFYKNSQLFQCYTECNKSFDIIQLIQNIYELNYNQSLNIFEAVDVIKSKLNKTFTEEGYQSIKKSSTLNLSNFLHKQEDITLQQYNDVVLDLFKYSKIRDLFQKEPISFETLEQFEIGYYLKKNCITFPWRDISGNLVAVKGRFLDWKEGSNYPKYMPVTVGDIIYKNKISLMLYGIFQNQHILKTKGTAFLFEGEKSVLKLQDTKYKGLSLAIGGQNIHPQQIKLLLQLNVHSLYLCFDKDFKENETHKKDELLKLIIKKAETLSPYFKTFILFDMDNSLNYKDSPIDQGINIFNKILSNRIQI